MELNTIVNDDTSCALHTFPDKSIDTVITSPPYFGLRDYNGRSITWPEIEFCPISGLPPVIAPEWNGSLGNEPNPIWYTGHLVFIFRELHRVLKDSSTVWLNLGDTFAANKGYQVPDSKWRDVGNSQGMKAAQFGLKPKDLIGIPWRVALALQADGWYLRSDIIWSKTNPMPESVSDRPTKAHEYLFLLAKSKKYYFDLEAVRQPAAATTAPRLLRGVSSTHKNINGAPGQTPHSMNQPRENARLKRDSFKRTGSKRQLAIPGQQKGTHRPDREESGYDVATRNIRTVWRVSTKPYSGAHFAVFPVDLVEPCVLAGCPPGGVILDPFFGAGTVAIAAERHQRNWVGIEINRDFASLALNRIAAEREKPVKKSSAEY